MKTFFLDVQEGRAQEIIEPVRDWYVPRLARCSCSNCGAHGYRRMERDGMTPREATGEPGTCTVCGGRPLVPVDK